MKTIACCWIQRRKPALDNWQREPESQTRHMTWGNEQLRIQQLRYDCPRHPLLVSRKRGGKPAIKLTGVFWPYTSEDDPGTPRLFTDRFAHKDGLPRFRLSRCIGCRACEAACRACDSHKGQSMITVDFTDRGLSVATQPKQWEFEFPYHWDADELASRHDLLQFAVYASGTLFLGTTADLSRGRTACRL